MSADELQVSDCEIDRLRELTNVGAGHAASAFEQLAGRQIRMSVPRLAEPADAEPHPRLLRAGSEGQPGDEWPTGVFFELEGAFGGLIGILLRAPMREALVRSLLGESEAPHPAEHVESALREFGNILVSRVATAIADTLGERILPSVPTLRMTGAGRELGRLARSRVDADPIRIECELSDAVGEIGGLLVMFPDPAPIQ